MNTYPRYYDDPYQKTLKTTVRSVEGSEVILTETIFYPEGGGQGGDWGTVNECKVTDTIKNKEGEIIHFVENPTFGVGDSVTLKLDWKRRYHFMKNHTAQHTASGLLYSRFGIGTVSVHLGNEVMTIEIDRDELSDSIGYELQSLVNAIILEGHEVTAEEQSHEDAEKLGLRRSIKVDGDVRLIHVDDVDTIACGGLHVRNTREIELFLYQGQERIRGHVRLIFIVGEVAWQRIHENKNIVDELGTLYSAPPAVLVETATKAQEAAKENSLLVNELRLALARALLEQKIASANERDSYRVITWDVTESITLKELGQVASQFDNLALAATQQIEGKLTWLIVLTGSAEGAYNFGQNRHLFLSPINGKGGGKAPIYQGVGEGDVNIFFTIFRKGAR